MSAEGFAQAAGRLRRFGSFLGSFSPAPGTSFALSRNRASINRRQILDLASRRADELLEVQILYIFAIVVGTQVTDWRALVVAYILIQFSELHGMILVRRIFAAAKDPDDMLERYADHAVIYEWVSASALAIAIAIGFIHTIPDWQLGALAFWCLAITYFVFPTIYCVRSLYGCIAIQLFGMVVTLGYSFFSMGKPLGVALASIGLALFAATTAAFMGRQLRADYIKQLEKERELAITVSELDRINANKTQFVAHLSHEMRTPLNGMMGVAALLKKADLESHYADHVDVVLRSGRALKELLDDSLDISRLEARVISPEPSPASLSQVLEDAISLYRPAAQARGLQITNNLSDDIPDTMSFDLLRVRQCIGNLLSNALKFSENGTVTITTYVDSSRRPLKVEIEVADEGIGIPGHMQQSIFDAYAQADDSTTRRFQGAGLGLSISRQLARLMGGDITVQSIPDEGSVFRFTFNAEPVDEQAQRGL